MRLARRGACLGALFFISDAPSHRESVVTGVLLVPNHLRRSSRLTRGCVARSMPPDGFRAMRRVRFFRCGFFRAKSRRVISHENI